MQSLDARFKVTPGIVNQTATTTTIASATATVITGTKVYINPREAGNGLTFRYKLSGTQTGTNAAHVITLYLGSTAVCALTADAATAVDWFAEFTIVFVSHKVQKVMGWHLQDTEDAEVNYAAGTVDCSGGITMAVYGTSHASDSLACELVTVEKWQYSPMTTA
jgi:hypothetical protein